jgi:signal transduction histidine kinase
MTGRRRAALNEALHELRRPLQALALAVAAGRASPVGLESSVQLATAALDRLDGEINGRGARRAPGPVAMRPLLEAAVGRWRSRASLGGGSLVLRCEPRPMVLDGDRLGLSQALDNLIVNAIEHGGPSISLAGRVREGRVVITVEDSGRDSRPRARRGTPAEVLARLRGSSRRGHGLAVVRRVAAAHGGRFELRRSTRGSTAVLELPLGSRAAGVR